MQDTNSALCTKLLERSNTKVEYRQPLIDVFLIGTAEGLFQLLTWMVRALPAPCFVIWGKRFSWCSWGNPGLHCTLTYSAVTTADLVAKQ
jgi:hypothetical protein